MILNIFIAKISTYSDYVIKRERGYYFMGPDFIRKLFGGFTKNKTEDFLKIGAFQLENLTNQQLPFNFYIVGSKSPELIVHERAQIVSLAMLKSEYAESENKASPIILAGDKKYKAAQMLEAAGMTQVFIFEDME